MSDHDQEHVEGVGGVIDSAEAKVQEAAAAAERPGNGVRSVLEELVREMLPSLASKIMRPGPEVPQLDEAGVERIVAELESTRRELEQLRSEKLSQDREIFLREQIRSLGVRNVDLAYRAVREDVHKDQDGSWIAEVGGATVPATQFLKQFIARNPDLIPARMILGSGAPSRTEEADHECDLDQIRPGMDPASMRRAREAVVRIIAQTKRSL